MDLIKIAVVLAFSLKGRNNTRFSEYYRLVVVLAFSLKGKNNTGMAIRK